MSKEEILNKIDFNALTNHDKPLHVVDYDDAIIAMEEYADQSTSHLQAKLSELERENEEYKQNYISAVGGRKDFRDAYNELREENKTLSGKVEELERENEKLRKHLALINYTHPHLGAIEDERINTNYDI